jgi:hypothetical protein
MSITIRTRGGADTITLNFKTISEDTTSSRMKIGTGTGNPTYIRFGYEKSVTATGSIHLDTDYAILKKWNGDIILDCTVSSYPEIVVSTPTTPTVNLLIVDSIKLSRAGGYLNRWDYSIKFIQGDLANLKRWT